jgi:hypothetical protein
MNIIQKGLLEKMISETYHPTGTGESQAAMEILYASPNGSAGGKKREDSGEHEIDAPQASDDKRAKQDNTGRAQGEDIANKAKDQKEDASITEPDTNLTGDTGNLDIGQTDLGASGTGAEDL